jgi:hypothetical protein
VISGYQFLLRYYNPNDKIYIFGFSRGAYTARFLTEMIDHIGLLSMGNEEMIAFAWDTFSKYQRFGAKEDIDFMASFKSGFCRGGVKVHFLGLFDCVNSVLAFTKKMPMPKHKDLHNLPAKYVRHAVSIHDRRGTFQPVLFDPEPLPPSEQQTPSPTDTPLLMETWFAGNHGDVGGGWAMYKGTNHLLSDIPLMWMIEQVRDVDKASLDFRRNTSRYKTWGNFTQFPGLLTGNQFENDDNGLAWREQVPPTTQGSVKVRSGNWEAVIKHARDQIDKWTIDETETPEKCAERVITTRKTVHDVLQHRTEGPGASWRKGWLSLIGWWLSGELSL